MKPELREYHFPDGSIRSQEWYVDNGLHREDGPAVIDYWLNGSIQIEEWWVNNRLHREDGPTKIAYNKEGLITYRVWHLNGKLLNKHDFTSIDMIKQREAFPLFSAIEIARMKVKENG